MDPFTAPIFDEDSEWMNPAPGLQSDACNMQGAAAGTCGAAQYVEPQYAEPQYVEPQYAEPQYAEPQYPGSYHQGPRYVEPQSLGTQYLALHHQAPYYQIPKHEELQNLSSEIVEPQYPKLQVQHIQTSQPQGLVRSERQTSSIHGPDYVHSVTSCERLFGDVNTHMQYLNDYSSTAYTIPSLPYASNNISATLPLFAGPNRTDEKTHSISNTPRLNGRQTPNTVFNHWNLEATSNPARHSILYKRLTCDHPGCGKGFGRQGDLIRHARDHKDGPKEYDCPAPNCRRKGADGFNRFDKLKSHLSAKHPEIKVRRNANGTLMFSMED
ncbi:MAG: hypothetical protein LQ342_001363 [Letrouitia transgressa]|nr:MAG: hypothetical protein LQ342_001363 [Letrouitia transgressa]